MLGCMRNVKSENVEIKEAHKKLSEENNHLPEEVSKLSLVCYPFVAGSFTSLDAS